MEPRLTDPIPNDARWDIDQLPRVMHHLVDVFQPTSGAADLPFFEPEHHDPEKWIVCACEQVSLEAIGVRVAYRDFREMVGDHAPAVFPIKNAEGRITSFYVATDVDDSNVVLLGTNFQSFRVPIEELLEEHSPHALERIRDRYRGELDILKSVLPDRSDSHEKLIFAEVETAAVWLFRRKPNAQLLPMLRGEGILTDVVLTSGAEIGRMLLSTLTWILAIQLAFAGTVDIGWFAALVLSMLGSALFGIGAYFSLQRLSIVAGAHFNRFILYGLFALEDHQVRAEGAGKSLTRSLESSELISVLVVLGVRAVSAVATCVVVAALLPLAPSSGALLLSFLLMIIVMVFSGFQLWKASESRVDGRLEQTHHLFDIMAGFRTLIAQGTPWSYEEEDRDLGRYTTSVDRQHGRTPSLLTFPPYLWLLLSMSILALAASGGEVELVDVVFGGGLSIAGFHAAMSLSLAVAQALPLFASSRRVAEIVQAARRPTPRSSPLLNRAGDNEAPIVSMRGVGFSYSQQRAPVLQDVSWDIRSGDRFLLRGVSGSGKSTLVSLLSGLREPSTGLMFVNGFDTKSLGVSSLQRVVALAPQFHENLILDQSMLFNLCVGRRWPPTAEDMDLIEQICEELGLQELVDRMPQGLGQLVGEGGWRLSHGEKSRIFLARTLMQECPVVVLDESFAALDPQTLEMCIDAVLRRTEALVVIEHVD